MDSRAVSFTNKDRIQQQIDLWGEESDFIKVRWLGEFPSSSNAQLIPVELIREAQSRAPMSTPFEPLIIGVDVARMGKTKASVYFRRGKDGAHHSARTASAS